MHTIFEKYKWLKYVLVEALTGREKPAERDAP